MSCVHGTLHGNQLSKDGNAKQARSDIKKVVQLKPDQPNQWLWPW